MAVALVSVCAAQSCGSTVTCSRQTSTPIGDIYIRHTSQNPAERPSRRCKVRKWLKVKRHLEGRAKQERQRVRKSLGPLRSLAVQPKTRARYDNARDKFCASLRSNQLLLPRVRSKMDVYAILLSLRQSLDRGAGYGWVFSVAASATNLVRFLFITELAGQ